MKPAILPGKLGLAVLHISHNLHVLQQQLPVILLEPLQKGFKVIHQSALLPGQFLILRVTICKFVHPLRSSINPFEHKITPFTDILRDIPLKVNKGISLIA